MKKILVVCSGNICRSPMAEVILKAALAKRRIDGVTVCSAGTGALHFEPAVEQAVNVCQEENLDLSRHRSQLLTPDIVVAADMVLVMEKRHRNEILRAVPEAEEKVHLLGSFVISRQKGDAEIFDPYGPSREAFRKCFEEIKEAVYGFANYLEEKIKPPKTREV